jgi:hypothetical protein
MSEPKEYEGDEILRLLGSEVVSRGGIKGFQISPALLGIMPGAMADHLTVLSKIAYGELSAEEARAAAVEEVEDTLEAFKRFREMQNATDGPDMDAVRGAVEEMLENLANGVAEQEEKAKWWGRRDES